MVNSIFEKSLSVSSGKHSAINETLFGVCSLETEWFRTAGMIWWKVRLLLSSLSIESKVEKAYRSFPQNYICIKTQLAAGSTTRKHRFRKKVEVCCICQWSKRMIGINAFMFITYYQQNAFQVQSIRNTSNDVLVHTLAHPKDGGGQCEKCIRFRRLDGWLTRRHYQRPFLCTHKRCRESLSSDTPLILNEHLW